MSRVSRWVNCAHEKDKGQEERQGSVRMDGKLHRIFSSFHHLGQSENVGEKRDEIISSYKYSHSPNVLTNSGPSPQMRTSQLWQMNSHLRAKNTLGGAAPGDLSQGVTRTRTRNVSMAMNQLKGDTE